MIPTLDDKALANLRDNARRLEAGDGRQQQKAAEALPLIEAELANRLALKPPKKTAKPRVAKAKAATMAPAGCQPLSRNRAISASPPRASMPNETASAARKPGAGSSAARIRCGREKIRLCGSATCGDPEKTNGFHQGHSPRCSESARNCNCAWKCALASHGTVTRPESQG